MSYSLNEIAYNIYNIMEGGRGTNQEYYSLRQIMFNVRYYRSLLLHREKSSADLQEFEQEITIPLGIVSVWDDHDCGINPDDFSLILKSIDPVPQTVHIKGGYDLNWIGTADRKSIPLKRFYQISSITASTYSRMNRFAYITNGYLYIIGDPGVVSIMATYEEGCPIDQNSIPLNCVLGRGVFEDPTVLEGFDDILVQNYPITGDYVQRITQSLLNGEMQMMRVTEANTGLNEVPDAKAGNN